MMGFGSYVAAVAEVSVGDDGTVKVHRIVAATDPGHALNPQQIDAQIAGSFVYGLSAALYQECTVKDGRIEQTNFDTYPVMRHGRDAGGRDDRDAVRRVLGRGRRADDRGGGPGRAQRHLRRHRQARAPDAVEEHGPAPGVSGHRLRHRPACSSAAALVPAAAERSAAAGSLLLRRLSRAPGPRWARSTGVPEAEIAAAMAEYRSGARPASVMGRIAKGFSEDESRAIAAYWLEATE